MFNAQQEPWYQILDKEKKIIKNPVFFSSSSSREEKRKKKYINEMKEFKKCFCLAS